MNSKEHKQLLLEKLYEPYKKCIACPLGTLGRTSVVFGEGNPDSRLLLIGEGPGKNEDEQGKPFVGRSGQLLTKVLTMCGIDRNEIFITNIVKCRPPNNRKPSLLESQTCKKLLLFNQIKIIQPTIICTLGSSALEGLLEKKIEIKKIRGTEQYFDSTCIIPTYHPAYILRNPKELDFFIADLKKAVNYSTSDQ